MTDLEFVVNHLAKYADTLDDSGRIVEASHIDSIALRMVTAGYGGGAAEYIGKLLELARNKGIDYMVKRMSESRIVTLNDGTPILKENDDKGFIEAVTARARALKLPETKGLTPNSPGKIDSKWSKDFNERMLDVAQGKSKWLNQAKPFTDAVNDKHKNNSNWEPTPKPVEKAGPVQQSTAKDKVQDAIDKFQPDFAKNKKPQIGKPKSPLEF